MAAAAVMGALLLIGGMAGGIAKAAGTANAASPGGAPQIINSIAPTATTTTLTPSPVSPVPEGTMVMLNATVTPAAAAGAVQFKDGTTDLGTPVTVSNGVALGTTSRLAAGSRQLIAVFMPTDPAAFGASTSPAVTFVVVAAPPAGPAATSTALTTSPASPVAPGTGVTLIATVTPATAAGTVQFKDGTANLGSPAAVNDGTASQTTMLAVGSRQLTAMFMPADSAAFRASMSSEVPVTVTAPQTTNPQAQQSGTQQSQAQQSGTQQSGTQQAQAQQSGQSLDGGANAARAAGGRTVVDLDGRTRNGGLTVLDLNLGGGTDNRGSTLLDLGGGTNNGGLTLLDLNLGGSNDSRAQTTVVDGRGVTVLRSDDDDRGLLGDLLDGLL